VILKVPSDLLTYAYAVIESELGRQAAEKIMAKTNAEFEKFDKVIGGLLSVPYSELQEKLETEKQDKAERKKKQSTSTASSRVSRAHKKRVA
jgi:inner membrane protein involved in colicin E2 resistance